MLGPVALLVSLLLGRLRQARQDERGMTTETMIITAMLAAAALGAVAVIVNAIANKGDEIGNDIQGALGYL
jgi:hypothetical protein